jgi:hypothetical protein
LSDERDGLRCAEAGCGFRPGWEIKFNPAGYAYIVFPDVVITFAVLPPYFLFPTGRAEVIGFLPYDRFQIVFVASWDRY